MNWLSGVEATLGSVLTLPWALLGYSIALWWFARWDVGGLLPRVAAQTGVWARFAVQWCVMWAVMMITSAFVSFSGISLSAPIVMSLEFCVLTVMGAATARAASSQRLRPRVRSYALLAACYLVSIGAAFGLGGRILFPASLPRIGECTESRDVWQIGLTRGPSLAVYSGLMYSLLRPMRGSVVWVMSEALARVPARWQLAMERRFHFVEDKYGAYVGRVIGMPGESVRIDGTTIFVNDMELRESYAGTRVMEESPVIVHLGPHDYLLVEDCGQRSPTVVASYVVVHERQVFSRQLFVVWPLQAFGFVRAPHYDVADQGLWRPKLSEKWWRRLALM